VLVFVGLKMVLSDLYSIPVYLSLLVIVGVLAASVGASLLRPERPPRREPARRPAHSEGGI
jgi:tellurite resistance protein TerC